MIQVKINACHTNKGLYMSPAKIDLLKSVFDKLVKFGEEEWKVILNGYPMGGMVWN